MVIRNSSSSGSRYGGNSGEGWHTMDRCRRNEKIRRCQGGGRVGMLEDGGSCMCRDELTLFSRDVVYTLGVAVSFAAAVSVCEMGLSIVCVVSRIESLRVA